MGAGSGGGSGYGSSSMAPATPLGGGAAAQVVKVGQGSRGRFLVDGDGRTLYAFKADHGTRSACSGECALDWPPLTTNGWRKAGGGIDASLLGTAKRTDGMRAVTYAGQPLYTYAGDTAAGQVTGQGSTALGGPWWVVAPSGSALTS